MIPKVTTQRREYVPIGWIEPPVIPSDLVFVLEGASLTDFALLTSAMHMAWLRCVGGRLASSYRYSIGVVYNTFPTPPPRADLAGLEPLAKSLIDVRSRFESATLSDLYNPESMPTTLRRAHQRLDRAVDRAYRTARFNSERDRIEHLFMRYEELRRPLSPKPSNPNRRSRRRMTRIQSS